MHHSHATYLTYLREQFTVKKSSQNGGSVSGRVVAISVDYTLYQTIHVSSLCHTYIV